MNMELIKCENPNGTTEPMIFLYFRFFKKTKHILRAAEGLRDYVARNVFVLKHIPGTTNLADILTKAQAVAVFASLLAAYDVAVSRSA